MQRFITPTFLSFFLIVCLNPLAHGEVFNDSDALVTIGALRDKHFDSMLKFETHRYENEKYSGDLYSYESDGLKVYALINIPKLAKPEPGYPIVIFGHGFHPDPENYAVSKSGKVSRPGDYYRGIPEAYAARGFMVVSPDYRGHNISEGFKYTKTSYLASSYYASDVLHALSGLSTLQNADLNRIYYVGHSMGGDVGLKVLLASEKIKAASLWSPVAASTDQQALYYGKYYDDSHAPDDEQVNAAVYAHYTKKVDDVYATLPKEVTKKSVDPINYLDELDTPILLQHARGDQSVPYVWSESLFVKLMQAGIKVVMHSYDSKNHLFSEENRTKAIERDIEFFSAN